MSRSASPLLTRPSRTPAPGCASVTSSTKKETGAGPPFWVSSRSVNARGFCSSSLRSRMRKPSPRRNALSGRTTSPRSGTSLNGICITYCYSSGMPKGVHGRELDWARCSKPRLGRRRGMRSSLVESMTVGSCGPAGTVVAGHCKKPFFVNPTILKGSMNNIVLWRGSAAEPSLLYQRPGTANSLLGLAWLRAWRLAPHAGI
jgi:hypothetical protein